MQGISWLAAETVSFSRRTLLHETSKYIPQSHTAACYRLKRNGKRRNFFPFQEGSVQYGYLKFLILVAIVSSPPKKGFLHAKGPFKTVFTVSMNIFIYYYFAIYFIVGLNRSVGIMTRYWLDGLGTNHNCGEIFSTRKEREPGPNHPPVQWVQYYSRA